MKRLIVKRLIVTTTMALGLACISSAAAAAEQYTMDLSNGFAIKAFVAHSPAELAQVKREVQRWEGQRHVGLGPQSIVAVAIDDSEGVATTRAQPISSPQALNPGMNVADVQSH